MSPFHRYTSIMILLAVVGLGLIYYRASTYSGGIEQPGQRSLSGTQQNVRSGSYIYYYGYRPSLREGSLSGPSRRGSAGFAGK